jgi:tryptophan-rich sensory protein
MKSIFANAKIKKMAASILPPLIAVLATNALIFALGVTGSAVFKTLPLAPPGWAIGAIWVVLYVFYGLAHYVLKQAGKKGRAAARWVVGLMIWGILYPFTSMGFDPYWGAFQNVVSVIFTMAALFVIFPVSRVAGFWLLPSLFWELFATCLGFAALEKMAA